MVATKLKIICDVCTAVFSLAAGLAWIRAASAPIPFLSLPDSSDSSGLRAALDSYSGFQRGVLWNKRAATYAAIAALSSSLSVVVSLIAT